MSRSVEERRRGILDVLKREGEQNVRELSERLGVSSVTLRRDVETLAARGLLHRTHGTVRPVQTAGRAGAVEKYVLGMVIPAGDYYYERVIEGAKAAAAAAGCSLVLGISGYDKATELQQVDRLLAKGVDGLVIAPTPEFDSGQLDAEQQQWLVSLSVPVVLIERPVASGGAAGVLDSISSSHAVGATLAVHHLAELGHTRIACVAITGPNSTHVLAGYRSAVASLGIESLGTVRFSADHEETVRDRILELVEAGATAFLVHNDVLALRCLAWLDDAGVDVPARVSLISYDDVFAAVAAVPITAVAPWREAVGQQAVQRLVGRIGEAISVRGRGGPGSAAEHRELIPRLHVRQSTAAPAKLDRHLGEGTADAVP
ncbi:MULTISPECIES: substrate-binding domain-containing protein [Arthrobacter]|uniref:Substrate-binding domain-containing protein n=2 Tax=Arthrobacter TaxID=1663 RepID=A0ABU9KK87_9MICC|nr:substrate-binding domain-containing protein [Arthrobacter sp. YJM1]MDP5227315.1 substrate-binding domain-containing protein [Arthrobacter sp. YJM1]